MMPQFKSVLAVESCTLADAVKRFNADHEDRAYNIATIRNKFTNEKITAQEIADLLSVISYRIDIINSSGEHIPAENIAELVKIPVTYSLFDDFNRILGNKITFIKD